MTRHLAGLLNRRVARARVGVRMGGRVRTRAGVGIRAGVRMRAIPRSARRAFLCSLGLVCASWALGPALANASDSPFISGFSATTIATTQPPNGDQNPYGIVTVPRSVGLLQAGDLLVSNFNDATTPQGTGNTQGTGTTIVQIPRNGNSQVPGTASVFAQINPSTPCPGGVGLTTALTATRSGFVIVGSLPTTDGQLDTAGAGCLLVLDSHGNVVKTIAGGPINGPWDMTAVDHGFFTTLYVTNVENGAVATAGSANAGTVVRIQLLTIPGIRPVVLDEDVIATGFQEVASSTAVVLGPTGVALSRNGTLYIADTAGSRIAAIPDASGRQFPIGGGGITLTSGGLLNGPLGMTLAPNGDILTANGGDGLVVETTPGGQQVANVDTGFGAGSLFGLTVPSAADRGDAGFGGESQVGGTDPRAAAKVYLVDDGNNTLAVLQP